MRICRGLLVAALAVAIAATGSMARTAPSLEAVTLSGGSGATAWSLPATLALPERDGPVPCIVFFAGSGPTDRDWLSPLLPGGNGSGKQLATALQAKGIGSIRFDKVGSGDNMHPLDVLSLAHYVAEATAVYDFLAGRPECAKLWLLGHSEGSIHALSAAVAKQGDSRFGGVISLSGPSRPMMDVFAEQVRAKHERLGDDMAAVDQALATFEAAMAAPPGTAAPDLSRVPDAAMLYAAAQIPQQARVMRELLAADPLAAAKAFGGRALIVSAARDAQVPASDGDRLFAALASPPSAKTRVTIADANHAYKTETRDPKTLSPQEVARSYADDGHALAGGVVEAIVEVVAVEPPR